MTLYNTIQTSEGTSVMVRVRLLEDKDVHIRDLQRENDDLRQDLQKANGDLRQAYDDLKYAKEKV